METSKHSVSYQASEGDVEKQGGLQSIEVNVTKDEDKQDRDAAELSLSSSDQYDAPQTPVLLKGKLARWNAKVEGLAGLEARGIARVLPEEKHDGGRLSFLKILALWVGINTVALNIITGFLGPLVFQLGWVDCVCIVIFANALSAGCGAYISTFGPESGNRTMIVGRFFMGYWPSKLAVILNIVMQVGWAIIACIVAGQMISAVNGKGLSIALGCVITAVCVGLVATFGIALVHRFERFAWIPQVFAMLVLIGSAGKNFDTKAVSVGSADMVTANRCSFFALQFASAIGFAALGADFFVYYPTSTPKLVTFSASWLGLWGPYMFCNILGVGIGTGTLVTPAWNDAYNISSGALLLACYDGLGGFGGFCVTILALGSITNMAPCAYAAALDFQALGRYAKAIPRWIWCIVITLIQLVCSVAGRNNLFSIFQNFIPIMSYWVCPWLTIGLQEHLLFHILRGVPFDWAAWEDRKKLPIGVAALTAWLIGWAGAIIGMSQVWYQGPIALMIGGYGGDIGAWLAIAFAGVTYPPLRYLELKMVGR